MLTLTGDDDEVETHPIEPRGDTDEVLETHPPLGGRLPLIVVVVLLLAGGAAVAIKLGHRSGRSTGSPSTSASTTPGSAPGSAPGTAGVNAGAVLIPSTSVSLNTTVDRGVAFRLYETTLTNVTPRSVRVSGPIVAQMKDGTPLPAVVVVIMSRQAANSTAKLTEGGRLTRIGPHRTVALVVRQRLTCSHPADQPPDALDRASRIIVPLNGYTHPAVYRFGTLFSGLPMHLSSRCPAHVP